MSQHTAWLHAPQKQPWKKRQIPYIICMIAMAIWSICFLIAMAGFGVFVVNVEPLLSNTTQAQPQPGIANLLIIAILTFGASVFIMTATFPFMKEPSDFKLPYRDIPAATAGHPFVVHFRRHLLSRSYIDEGMVQFKEHTFHIYGALEPNGAIRSLLLILVIITFPIAVIPVIGGFVHVGMIWLRSRFDHVSQIDVAYAEISSIALRGCRVQLRCHRTPAERITFCVARQDGERLYHELHRHLPASVGGWSPASS